MADVQVDVNDIINNLIEQIAGLTRDNAVLKAHVAALSKEPTEEGETE